MIEVKDGNIMNNEEVIGEIRYIGFSSYVGHGQIILQDGEVTDAKIVRAIPIPKSDSPWYELPNFPSEYDEEEISQAVYDATGFVPDIPYDLDDNPHPECEYRGYNDMPVNEYLDGDFSISLHYGSSYYGESRDLDLIEISVRGRPGHALRNAARSLELACDGDIILDKIRITDRKELSAFDYLALKCILVEYPSIANELMDAFEWDEELLYITILENTEKRMEAAKIFPCDFTLRKALFAYVQMIVYEEEGVFVDTKSKALQFLDEIKAEAQRLLFHKSTESDLKRVYEFLFQNEKFPDILMIEISNREFLLRNKDKILVGRYASYGTNYQYEIGEATERMKEFLCSFEKLSKARRVTPGGEFKPSHELSVDLIKTIEECGISLKKWGKSCPVC